MKIINKIKYNKIKTTGPALLSQLKTSMYIAKKCGVSVKTINLVLSSKTYKEYLRCRYKSFEDARLRDIEIKKMYMLKVKGAYVYSIPMISNTLKVSVSTILKVVKNYNLPKRSAKLTL